VILLHTAPVAFLAPLWAGVRLPLSKGRWTALMAGSILTGALINAIWVVPEFIGLSKAYGWELLWTQTFGRVEGQIGHPRPVWFFLVLMPAVLFPWIASRAFWSKRAWKKALEAESVRLGLVWFGGAVLLHSLSSGKQLHYLLPSLPGAALVLAGLLEAGPDKDRAQRAPIAAGAALILLVASALLAAAALPATAARLAGIDIAIATLSALGLVICGLACWGMARVPDRWRMPGAAVAGLGAILLIQASLPSVWERNDAARIAAAVPELRDAPAAWIGTYQGEFTFAARRTMPVENLEQLDAALEWLKLHPTGVVLWRTTQREIHMAGIRDSLLPWRGRSLAVLRLAAH
jgi:4-amino-4-deoxy-L-arabinose transferase-like glycosyltransferase